MLEQDVFKVVSERFDAADHMVWYITVRASCIKRPPMYINIKTWSVVRFIAPTLFVLCQDMINKLRKRVNVGNSILALQIIRLQYFINVRRGQSKIKCNNFKVSWMKLKSISISDKLYIQHLITFRMGVAQKRMPLCGVHSEIPWMFL